MLIQAITNQSNYKIQFPRFTGSPRVATKPIQAAADSFVRSAEKPVFDTIRDINNYLKINVDKIKDGEIFNTPITKDGDSLLMAFLHIKPIPEEEEEYESLLYKMEKMLKINYDQKDSMDMTSLEWMMAAENFALLGLMKDKKLTQDPMTHTTYKHIKNPEFRKALVESGVYKPMFETLKNTMDKYSKLGYSLYETMYRYSSCVSTNRAQYKYTQKEIEGLRDLFTYFEYGTENFKEDKQEFLKTISPFVANFIGFYDINKIGKHERRNIFVYNSGLDLEQAHENLINLYYMTGGNKQFYKDILTDVFKNEKGARMFDFQDIYTLKEIYKDNLDDFIDILLAMGEKNEFIQGNNLDDCRNLLEELKHGKISKTKLKNLYDALSWHDKNRYDSMRAVISSKINTINSNAAYEAIPLRTITDYLKNNKSKINDGEIFNLPMPYTDVTPLIALARIKVTEGEEKEFQALIESMKKMSKIDFNQKDKYDNSFIENVFRSENKHILPIIPDNLLYDASIETTFNEIKDENFKKTVQEMYLFQNNPENADWIAQSTQFGSKLLKTDKVLDDASTELQIAIENNSVNNIKKLATRAFLTEIIGNNLEIGKKGEIEIIRGKATPYQYAKAKHRDEIMRYLEKFPHVNPVTADKYKKGS